jgi:hypothetical protein
MCLSKLHRKEWTSRNSTQLALKLLGWFPTLLRTQSPMTAFTIDLFNYSISQVAVQVKVFWRIFREATEAAMEALPQEVRRSLLVIDPPEDQELPPGPLFADFELDSAEDHVSYQVAKEKSSSSGEPDVFDMWFG